MAEPERPDADYEPPYFKLHANQCGDFEFMVLAACIELLERVPLYPCSRDLQPAEKSRIATYLAARYALNGEAK